MQGRARPASRSLAEHRLHNLDVEKQTGRAQDMAEGYSEDMAMQRAPCGAGEARGSRPLWPPAEPVMVSEPHFRHKSQNRERGAIELDERESVRGAALGRWRWWR